MSTQLLLNNKDLGDNLLQTGSSTSTINDVIGILTKARQYVITDNKGENSFLSNSGFLSQNAWRSRTIKETNDRGITVFDGVVQKPALQIDKGYRIAIEAREPLGTFLNWPVESNSIVFQNPSNGLTDFTVNGNQTKGETEIEITYNGALGSAEIPNNTLITFDNSLVPRYFIVGVTNAGGFTTSVTIDRPLEETISSGSDIRVSEPAVRTGASELKQTLTAAGLGSRLDSSFDIIDQSDTANNYLLWINIQKQDGVTLASHVQKILELSDLYLSTSTEGILSVRRGIIWDGIEEANTLTESELIPPLNFQYAFEKLIVGYDCAYNNGGKVDIASGDVDQFYIDTFAGKQFWQPISVNDNSIQNYNYLYFNATTADFFGQRRIDYYQVPRLRLQCRIKQSFSGQVKKAINAELLKDFGISAEVAPNRFFVNEPATTIEVNYNDKREVYNSVTFEFTNYGSLNIPRDIPAIIPPIVDTLTGDFNGFSVTFSQYVDQVFCDIYLDYSQSISILSKRPLVVGNNTTAFQNNLLLNNQTYYIIFYSIVGGIQSQSTKLLEFTTTNAPLDTYGSAKYGLGVYT
jgi:hypothetical protein